MCCFFFLLSYANIRVCPSEFIDIMKAEAIFFVSYVYWNALHLSFSLSFSYKLCCLHERKKKSIILYASVGTVSLWAWWQPHDISVFFLFCFHSTKQFVLNFPSIDTIHFALRSVQRTERRRRRQKIKNKNTDWLIFPKSFSNIYFEPLTKLSLSARTFL